MKKNLILNIFLLSLITILFIFYTLYWFLIIPFIYLGIIFWKYKNKYLIIFVFLFLAISTETFFTTTLENENYYHEAKVVKVYTNSVVVKEEKEKYFITIENSYCLNKGDTIAFEGTYDDLEKNSSFDRFVFSTGSIGYLNANMTTVVKKSTRWRDRVYTDLKSKQTPFTNYALVLFYKTTNENNQFLLDGSVMLGISFLIIISGFHISLIMNSLDHLSTKVLRTKKFSFIIASFMTLYFLYFIYWPPTGLRAWINKNLNHYLVLSKNDTIAFTGLFFLLFNPFNIFSNGLILSFLITFLIVNLKFKKNWSWIQKEITIAILAFCISFPIISTWENKINLTAPLITIVAMPLVSFLYTIMIPLLFLKWLQPLAFPILTISSLFFKLLALAYIPLTINLLSWRVVIEVEILFFIELHFLKNYFGLLFLIIPFETLLLFYNLTNEIYSWNWLIVNA